MDIIMFMIIGCTINDIGSLYWIAFGAFCIIKFIRISMKDEWR